jgi:hypothetical protein
LTLGLVPTTVYKGKSGEPKPVPTGESTGKLGEPKPSDSSAQGPGVDVYTLTFQNDADLQKWLNDQMQKKNSLLGIVPLKNQESLFVIKPGKEESLVTQLVNSALNVKNLKERINLFPQRTFIGIHLLSENSFLIVFRETR